MYELAVMFFGMSNAPATFQRAMDRIFTKIKNCYPGCIFVYMNDILIATNDDKELHEQIVHKVLKLLEEEDFHLKLNKCLFHQQSIDYLDIRIEGGKVLRIYDLHSFYRPNANRTDCRSRRGPIPEPAERKADRIPNPLDRDRPRSPRGFADMAPISHR